MARWTVSEWGRRLRKVVSNLTSSVRDIFGSTEAVIYRPPEPPPHRESGSSDDHGHMAARSASKAGLPPRERRGRD